MSVYRLASVDAAVYVLRDIDRSLKITQKQVTTGLRVATSRDNGAYWAISSTLKTDQNAHSAVRDALGLAAATMDVAETAVSNTIEIVSQIKAKLVAATEKGVDKTKINDEIEQLRAQLVSVNQSASFNGDNWVMLRDGDDPAAPREIPSAFIRYSDGHVEISKLSYDVDLAPVGSTTSKDARYIIDNRSGGTGDYGVLTSTHFATESGASRNYVLLKTSGNSAGQTEIGLTNTTTQEEVNQMVSVVEGMLGQLTGVGAAFGALSTRIQLQSEFAQNLDDSISRGIGRMIDADMEEQGTKLTALQTQQQLGLQSLNIANSSYQGVLRLFQGG